MRFILPACHHVLQVLPCKASCMARAANLRGALTGSEINTLECWNSKHVASILKATSGLVTATVDKAHELFSALLKQHPKASLAYQVSCVAVEDVDLCRQIGDGKSLETMLTLLRYNQHCSAVMEEELAAAKTVLLQASGDEATPGIEPHNQHHAADSYLHPAARFHHAQQHTADPVSTPTSGNDYLPGSSSLQLVLMTASTTDCEVLGRWLEAATPPVDAPCAPQRHLLKRVNADNQSWLWEHFQGSSTTHMTRLRKLSCEETLAGMTKDNVPEFCQSYLDRGKTVIVYCDTRESPEACAHEIARFVRDPWAGSLGEACAELEGTHQGHGSPGRESRQSVAAKLRELGRRSSQVLAALVVQGFAYHHAGLPAQERGLVEAAVTHGLISVLITTAASIHSISWAADVSIFRLASVGKGSIQERSSCAKAHRLLHSVRGAQGRECILTSASSVADSDLMGLLAADNAEVSSCLASEGNMRQALLVSIGRQFTCTALDVKTYVGCTLMSVLHGPAAAAAAAQAALCWLVKDAKLASWSEKTARYTLTRLGSTALEANLHPCQAGLLQRELGAARESLILTSQLHIAYLCVPLDWSIQPNWQALHQFMISARVGVGGSGHLELDRAASVYTQVVLASFASIAWAILLAWVPQVLCVRVNYPMVNAGFGGENRGSCGVESAVYHRPADGGWWQPRHAGAGGLVQPATPRTHLLPVFCGTAAARRGSRGGRRGRWPTLWRQIFSNCEEIKKGGHWPCHFGLLICPGHGLD
uniref:DNA polymerase theta-like helix-turn-helix domain-containing protein n=1 Tax=Auxenochlorella protothecoides TaxID=3075 RepID=A0A1D1ZPM1_AUXPR